MVRKLQREKDGTLPPGVPPGGRVFQAKPGKPSPFSKEDMPPGFYPVLLRHAINGVNARFQKSPQIHFTSPQTIIVALNAFVRSKVRKDPKPPKNWRNPQKKA
jgi:hypothetical protein